MESPIRSASGEYGRLSHLLQTGFIKEIHEIFDTGERKSLLADLTMSYKTLGRRMERPGTFKMQEISILAEKLQVDYKIIADLIYKAMQAKKKKGKR